MPLAVYRNNNEIVRMGESVVVKRKVGKKTEKRSGVLIGVNGAGTLRVRFEDTGADENVDPADVPFTVEAM